MSRTKPTKPLAKAPTKAERTAQQIQHNKKALLDALERSLGVVTTACRAVKLDRTTFYNYVNADPDFAAAVKEIDSVALDFAESQLYSQIRANIPSSTIFYLKTKGKGRGYIERHELAGADGGEIKIVVKREQRTNTTNNS